MSQVRSKYLREKGDPPTGVLPPYPLFGNDTIMMVSKYQAVEDVIEDLWEYCMELEDQYHHTGSHDILIKFATTLMIVQYWEDLLLSMEGIDVFKVYF